MPSARRKIAIDRFVIDDLLKSIAVAKGHSQDQRRLPFAFGAKDFDRHRRVDVQEKLKSLARQTPVQTDGILGKQLEVAAVASASFGGGIAAIDDGDVQAAIAHRRPEMIGRRCAGQPCADDQHVHGWGQCRRRLIIRQRMPGAKPEGLIADGQRNSLCRSDSNAPEELFKQLPGSGSESAIALQGLELAPHRRACGALAVSRDQLSGEAFHRIGGQDAPGAGRRRIFHASFRLHNALGTGAFS